MFNPAIVVQNAIERKISGIAITDHDSIDGIEEAVLESKKHNNIEIIPGIEFGCVYKNEEVHILGLFINYKDSEIINKTKILKDERKQRGLRMIQLVNDLGMKITVEDVMLFCREDFIGRPHIARALMKAGYVNNIQEAFNRYLARGKPAYSERFAFSIEEVIGLIKRIGGISSLAHPGLLENTTIIDYCISQGIQGIECSHSKHSRLQTKSFKKIAKNNNILITGGSDCHGDISSGELLLGKYGVEEEDIKRIKERL